MEDKQNEMMEQEVKGSEEEELTLKRAKKAEEKEEEERSANVCPPWKPHSLLLHLAPLPSISSCNGYSEVLTCVTSASLYTEVILSGRDDVIQAL